MIYISGAVSGTKDYTERFQKAEEWLLGHGHDKVINPVKIMANLPPETPYKVYMDLSLFLLRDCSEIYMLNGWEDSKGARLEHAYAETVGIPIIYQTKAEDDNRYFWRLNGKFSMNERNGVYLVFDGFSGLTLAAKGQNTNGAYLHTEEEYKEFARKHHFSEDMFVKEEV